MSLDSHDATADGSGELLPGGSRRVAGASSGGGLRQSNGLKHLLLVVLAWIGIILLVKLLETDYPFRVTQLATMAYYLPAIAGLTVLTGINGQISLGHGALMAVGAYTTSVLLDRQELPFIVVVLLSVLTASLVGLLVGIAAARLHGPYLAGATLALAVGVPGIAIYYRELFGGDQGLRVSPPSSPAWFESLTGDLGRGYITVLGWALALSVLFFLSNLVNSRYGRQWRAVRDDEVAASLLGINLGRSRVLAFVVSAGCAGVGGTLLAVVTRLTAPLSFTIVLSLFLLTAIVLGGLGSLLGAVLGAALLTFLPTFLSNQALSAGLDNSQAANLAPLVFGLVLVAVMLVAPRGLVGTTRTAYYTRKAHKRQAAQAKHAGRA